MSNSTAKFYYRSFIDGDIDGYTLSGDLTPLTNVNDRRHDTYASSDETGIGDGTSEEIVCDLTYDREIDTIFLKSNFKTFTVWIWDENETGTGGAGYVELTSYSANSTDFLKISFESVTTSKVKISCTHTIIANEEKKIYSLNITKYINEINIESVKIEKKFARENWKNIYGGSIQIVQYPNRGKAEIKLSWDNLSATDYAVYSDLKSKSLVDAFLVYFYFSEDYDLLGTEALYLVNDLDDKEATPSSETISSGVNGSMLLREC